MDAHLEGGTVEFHEVTPDRLTAYEQALPLTLDGSWLAGRFVLHRDDDVWVLSIEANRDVREETGGNVKMSKCQNVETFTLDALCSDGVQMGLNRLDEFLSVDGLGGVVVAAGLDAFLPVADHRMSGQCDDQSGVVFAA